MTLPKLRPYQEQLDTDITHRMACGDPNVLAVMPTGGGKTVNMGCRVLQHTGASIAIAHRQELVGQMSLALARCGIYHRIIGPPATRRRVVALQMQELGANFYDPGASAGVAGVDTLIRTPPDDPWIRQVTLWQTDEAHHLLRENKWGKAVKLFPYARGIGWTATPGRSDGYGLGRHADGVFDSMVLGPAMRWLIDNGYLTDYRILLPPSDLCLDDVPVTASGDFSNPKLRKAVHESHITGDIVTHYLREAAGALGITFAVDIDHATALAEAYRAMGVPAEVVTSKTPDLLRANILRRFREREILQLVNVDLFGEGFDLPAIEVVSMGRPTESYPLYAQQFGRVLRLLKGKTVGLVLDHVGNTIRHGGPPDREREWTLDRRERRGPQLPADGVPMRACPECTAPYPRTMHECPYCGVPAPVPAERGTPEQVEGDLVELDGSALAALRGEVSRIDGPVRIPQNLSGPAALALQRRHLERQQGQADLRAVMALWGGWRASLGEDTREAQKRFWYAFGVDVLTAQTYNAKNAAALADRVRERLEAVGVTEQA